MHERTCTCTLYTKLDKLYVLAPRHASDIVHIKYIVHIPEIISINTRTSGIRAHTASWQEQLFFQFDPFINQRDSQSFLQ